MADLSGDTRLVRQRQQSEEILYIYIARNYVMFRRIPIDMVQDHCEAWLDSESALAGRWREDLSGDVKRSKLTVSKADATSLRLDPMAGLAGHVHACRLVALAWVPLLATLCE
ncbi:uncharacterized protein L969DRAFT_49361 [Mixia osmundae IAM 14324]|uniref:Uncharacterized protein n=1 Tax=Mixia osmundae (strain CBS 9802 / IAM 14324 / JCM 22182 / KY 12970) TaxID=764103 RepID=G7E3F5_MIXOS|nr:uncharacterized protein L969DRAFT_49361 [Mixia osmundae IAM 14324]KEI39351.1 hypothetical protein L969DRAFT_49361 [Mixia osmundae IAM 14324]GAA97365.1 hypothetical protein E5Q_04043 [Mixia osmundae IAM 14324]